MCLIVLGWRAHPEYPLIVAANRDEFHARPAAPATFWDDQPGILAGRDLEARGTWMGVSRDGKFAAVTNFRGATEPRAAESRGALVTRFLAGEIPPQQYLKNLQPSKYSGFNLLLTDGQELWSMSNRDGPARRLEPGIYGLGNTLLDAPEVDEAKKRFLETLDTPNVETLFGVLAPAKILDARYGTRCSSVLLKGARTRYAERTFAPGGAEGETVQYDF